MQQVDGRVQTLHLWTVQNWDAAAGGGDQNNAMEAVAVDVDTSYLLESNEAAAAAYDSFDTDQRLQEDNETLAAVA